MEFIPKTPASLHPSSVEFDVKLQILALIWNIVAERREHEAYMQKQEQEKSCEI